MKKLTKYFYILLPIILGSIIGFSLNYNFYNSLTKPPLAPPKILFPIIWSIIYILMGISFYLYKKNSNDSNTINKTYYLQLIVNILWSIIFFGLKLKLFSCVWIILLDILVIYLIKLFLNHYKLSAYLNILYLFWTTFASYLTIGIYLLN